MSPSTVPKWHRPLGGFARVGDEMNEDKNRTATMSRIFDSLSARSLLLMEAEISELEARQARFDEEDLR
ncbi:hypothetical protein F5Y15DRAFT_269678 [Xylariaceae sp. FL0016]|nr:hypothetical protein F5Y15DRAFT_269678 [Xylariaceae sp. FL0016]